VRVTPSSHPQVLRATATLSTTVMFIPLVTTVVQLFNCHGTWGTVPSWQCFTSTHLAFCVVGAATILCFSVFSFVGAWSRGAGTLYPNVHWSSRGKRAGA
jgi:hypothetical protein